MMGGSSGKDVHLQFIKKSDRAEVVSPADHLVPTAPHLLVREAVAAEVVIIILALFSLLFNAPLEEIANPEHTPNPAKAPWYFLGLQELLHYFSPVVAGVLIPALVVIALVVIPYFGVNVRPRSLAALNRRPTTIGITALALLLCLVMLPFGCWPLIAVSVLVWGAMMIALLGRGRAASGLGRMTLPGWIMIWFVASASTLTIIGTFFRGPGWSWIWPWFEGIY